VKMRRGVSILRKRNIGLSPNGAQGTLNGEIVWVRPLTLRQRLYAFFGAKDEGSQVVEIAVVAPILLVILTGMASFGMALYSEQQLGLATAGAVQAVATGASYISNPCQTAAADVANTLPTWTAANLTYTLTIYTSSTSSTPFTWTGTSYPSTCATTGLNDLQATGSEFQPLILKVTYPYSWFPIFQWSKYGNTLSPSGNLQSTQAAMIQ
jgi:Flp pilus assembly protein TadG